MVGVGLLGHDASFGPKLGHAFISIIIRCWIRGIIKNSYSCIDYPSQEKLGVS
jgi:hypothetical protein